MSDRRARGQPLDARLREQVAELHREAAPPLSPLGADAQGRVLQALTDEAARLDAGHRRRRQLRAVGATALLAAAAAALVYIRAAGPVARPEPSAHGPSARPGPACALPLLDDSALAQDTGALLSLGKLGTLVTQPHSRVQVELSSACELRLRLDAGTLAGDLHSLRPARLVIRTAQGDVVITGTRFSVHSDDALEVLLASGVVDVQFGKHRRLRLQPGSRLRKPAGVTHVAPEPLSQQDAQRLSRWLLPPRAQPETAATSNAPVETESTHQKPIAHAAASSSELLAAAEAARRASHVAAAREAYRSASQGRDANAEVALLRWARFELEQRAPAEALRLVNEHARRFAHGTLRAEAGWLEVQARQALGQTARAQRAARRLVRQHAGTPQAEAASKLLAAP